GGYPNPGRAELPISRRPPFWRPAEAGFKVPRRAATRRAAFLLLWEAVGRREAAPSRGGNRPRLALLLDRALMPRGLSCQEPPPRSSSAGSPPSQPRRSRLNPLGQSPPRSSPRCTRRAMLRATTAKRAAPNGGEHPD